MEVEGTLLAFRGASRKMSRLQGHCGSSTTVEIESLFPRAESLMVFRSCSPSLLCPNFLKHRSDVKVDHVSGQQKYHTKVLHPENLLTADLPVVLVRHKNPLKTFPPCLIHYIK